MPAKEKVKNGELDLSSQGLKEIPYNTIANHKNITSINLSNNKLTSVGKGLGNLTSLVKLDLSKNQIKGLPDSIGNLTNLKHLNLSNNQLNALPAALGNLKSLKYLDVKNNPLGNKFAEVTGPCGNDAQCQQAAKNVLKAFGSDNDKKKKQKETPSANEQNAKKKNAAPANGAAQTKQKAKSKAKKTQKPTTILSKISGFFIILGKYSLAIAALAVISIYGLAFYNEELYGSLKARAVPLWDKLLTTYLSKETAAQLTDAIYRTGRILHNSLVYSGTFVIQNVRGFYAYVTTDKVFLSYIETVKVGFNNLWGKVSETANSAANQNKESPASL